MGEPIESWEEQLFPLVEAAKELKAADAAYRKMIKIGIHSFHEYERAWQEFLYCIERTWNKTCVDAQGKKMAADKVRVSKFEKDRPIAEVFDSREKCIRAHDKSEY